LNLLNHIVKQACSEIHSPIHWHEMFHDRDFHYFKGAFTKGSKEEINFKSIICLGVWELYFSFEFSS